MFLSIPQIDISEEDEFFYRIGDRSAIKDKNEIIETLNSINKRYSEFLAKNNKPFNVDIVSMLNEIREEEDARIINQV